MKRLLSSLWILTRATLAAAAALLVVGTTSGSWRRPCGRLPIGTQFGYQLGGVRPGPSTV